MSDANYFLTDEFIAFSKNMADLHGNKKAKQAEFAEIKEAFQKKYEEFKSEIQMLDSQAADLVAEWESWKSLQSN